MTPTEPKPLTMPQTIARAVRRERTKRNWNQEDLAEKMRDLGFPWTRMTVTEIERGDPDNDKATKRGQARQVSVEELLGLTYAFGMGLDALLWNDRPIELADRRPTPTEPKVRDSRLYGRQRGEPITLDTRWQLWIALMSFSSIETITEAQAATLMEAERQRVVSTMLERIDLLAADIHSTADWFRDEARDRLVAPIKTKEKKR